MNFLRDLKDDYLKLGRSYFPGINFETFDDAQMRKLDMDIRKDFEFALQGIRKLPKGARLGVYTAYVYYQTLMKKIVSLPSVDVLKRRIRIGNDRKIALFIRSYFEHNLNRI